MFKAEYIDPGNSATFLTASLTDMHANVYLSQWLIIIVVHVEGRTLVATDVIQYSIVRVYH